MAKKRLAIGTGPAQHALGQVDRVRVGLVTAGVVVGQLVQRTGACTRQPLVVETERGAPQAGDGFDPGYWRRCRRVLVGFARAGAGPRAALCRLLAERDEMQGTIDGWHAERRGRSFDQADLYGFLRDIGYLVAEPADFAVGTANVDPEIASIAGPQLVVPVSNARYALNAANARWGSLYDALYGTDAVPEDDGATRVGGFNKLRAARVVSRARALLDEVVPLAGSSHADATRYACVDGCLGVRRGRRRDRAGGSGGLRWLRG